MIEEVAVGRVAVVTGGSRGIGRAFVIEAAKRGYTVAFTHRGRKDDAAQTIKEAGPNAHGFLVDLVSEEAVAGFAKQVLELGPVGLLINNAGVGLEGKINELDPEAWRTSFTVHVDAPMWLSKHLIDSLRTTKGAILNISSTGGVVGSLHGVAYGASKSAVIGLAKTMAREFAPDVRVNALAPGGVATDMYRELPEDQRIQNEAETPLNRIPEPAEIARVGLDVCHWPNVTGQTIVADGGRVML